MHSVQHNANHTIVRWIINFKLIWRASRARINLNSRSKTYANESHARARAAKGFNIK